MLKHFVVSYEFCSQVHLWAEDYEIFGDFVFLRVHGLTVYVESLSKIRFLALFDDDRVHDDPEDSGFIYLYGSRAG